MFFFSIIIEEKIEKTTGQNNYKITQKNIKEANQLLLDCKTY